jgi:hypothetical protein
MRDHHTLLKKKRGGTNRKIDFKDSIIVPKDLKRSEIKIYLYNQLVVASEEIEVDPDYIEKKPKSSWGKSLKIIQDRKEELMLPLRLIDKYR